MRSIGQAVAVFNGRKPPVMGHIIGYAMVSGWRPSTPANIQQQEWITGYVVNLEEGCDTQNGLYLREIVVTEDNLTTDRLSET